MPSPPLFSCVMHPLYQTRQGMQTGLFRPGVKKAEPPTDGSAQLRQKCRNFCTSRSAPRTSIVSPSRKQ